MLRSAPREHVRPSHDRSFTEYRTLAEFLDDEMSRTFGGSRESGAWSTYDLRDVVKDADPTGEGISQGTAWRLLTQPFRVPHDVTLEKVAIAFDVPLTTVRALAKRPTGEVEPFRLPAEANQLTYAQRDAVIRMIRTMLDAAADGRRVTRQASSLR